MKREDDGLADSLVPAFGAIHVLDRWDWLVAGIAALAVGALYFLWPYPVIHPEVW